jgi:hypothetical protein
MRIFASYVGPTCSHIYVRACAIIVCVCVFEEEKAINLAISYYLTRRRDNVWGGMAI